MCLESNVNKISEAAKFVRQKASIVGTSFEFATTSFPSPCSIGSLFLNFDLIQKQFTPG